MDFSASLLAFVTKLTSIFDSVFPKCTINVLCVLACHSVINLENFSIRQLVLWLFAPEMQLCVLLFRLVPRVFVTVCLNFGLIKLVLCTCVPQVFFHLVSHLGMCGLPVCQ